jgi:hypothetical protein
MKKSLKINRNTTQNYFLWTLGNFSMNCISQSALNTSAIGKDYNKFFMIWFDLNTQMWLILIVWQNIGNLP